jgi:orotate phosphoribosyltransferase-like protein
VSAIDQIAAVVGGFAALGALMWAMIGNPSILSALRKRLKRASSPAHPPKRRILNIDWGQLDAATAAFATRNCVVYDLVVGVQPDGVTLANVLAGKLHTRYCAMDKHYMQSKRAPFFVFDQEKHSRSVRQSVTQFTPPPGVVTPSRILVVDGVTTFGNGLLKAEEEILKKYSNAQIDFYVYAIDQARLAASHPEITDRVKFHRSIDNHVTWLHFPWDSA